MTIRMKISKYLTYFTLIIVAIVILMGQKNALANIQDELTNSAQDAVKQAGSTIIDSISKTIEKSPDIIDSIKKNSADLKDKIITKNDKKKDQLSIMHSTEESSNIEKAVDAFKNGYLLERPQEEVTEEKEEEEEEDIKSTIYLHSILYQSPTNWTIWLNDDKITAEQNIPSNEMYMNRVSQDKIEILWTLTFSKWKILLSREDARAKPFINEDNQVELRFSLSPHQTYILDYDLVVDGRFEGKLSNEDKNKEE